MKNNITILFIVAIFSLSFVLYQAWVVVPKEKIQQRDSQQKLIKEQKDNFYRQYEDCKDSESVKYSFDWLRYCGTQKQLSKECKGLGESEIPWVAYYSYRSVLKGDNSSEYNQNGFNQFLEFQKMVADCSCPTLPSYLADKLAKNLEKAEQSCQKEFEVKLRTLE